MYKGNHTEEEAALLVTQGREEGLDFFFHRYYIPLTYFARNLTEDEAAAEDIAAEAFIKLWNHRTELIQPHSIKPYLYRTVRNASLDYLRHKKRRRNHQQEVVYLQPLSDETVLHHRIQTEVLHELFESLNSLPPKCGRVLHMAFIQGKSNGEIAAELKVSINTVKNQKVQGLKALREKLTLLCLLLSNFISY